MRKIQFQDTFVLARIIKKADVKDILIRANNSLKQDNVNKEDVFLDVLFSVLSGAADEGVENEIYELLGGVAEKGTDEIKRLQIDELIDLVKKIAKENDLSNFFKSAVKLTK